MEPAAERKWASMGHILSLIGIPTGGVGYTIPPLIIFFLKKGESPFVDEHVKETLNFSIITTVLFWIATGSAVAATAVGACFAWLVPGVLALVNLIFCIQGFSASKNGEAYRYPFNLRLIK